ncbi:MAG: UDP-glucose 4-epimerase GalE [Verrucomicrobiota bacterium]
MKVFVTGGAGYIGSVCVEEVLNAGHEVCVFDNLSEGHRSAVDDRAKFVQGDLHRLDSVKEVVNSYKPDAAIHFAGKALVGESMANPYLYYQTNVYGGTNLLEALVQYGCKRIVFSSTCATYGVPLNVPIDESNPQHPINPYGHSKLAFEQILRWYQKVHGLAFTALRYFNAAGASVKFGEHHRIETHLIPNVLKVALGQMEKVFIFGDQYDTPDGTCIRDYIHLIDLASAHIAALDQTESGHFNVGTGNGYSVMEVIEMCREVTGHAIPAEMMPAREGDPPRLVADPRKIKNELHWSPKHAGLKEIVTSAWNWHKLNPEGYKD